MTSAVSRLHVVFVELPAYEGTLPLASGYLQAFAQQDPAIATRCRFTVSSRQTHRSPDELLEELAGLNADVYAMSCYLWNMRRIKWLFEQLAARLPDARFVLGGPQVMNHAADYLPVGFERAVVCNGEGERTFAAYLRQMLSARPAMQFVPGVSFWDGGELVTTPAPDRIGDLAEIPSPFAAGIFDGGEYTFAVVETNRGCPFHCGFCFWGAATNDKVHKFDIDRAKADLSWISEHLIESIFIADANWGLAPRDVELTRHIVECRQNAGYPLTVVMQAAKNRPERMAEITEILVNGGLLTSQPVSLQTLNPRALELIARSNIKESTFIDLQRSLRERNISSYAELIWPLPGETLESFQTGIERLCRSGADTIVAYPQMLLHNTPLYRQRELYGIKTVEIEDDVAEAEVVVATDWVTQADAQQGTWFYYAVASLYNARAAYYLATYLDRAGQRSYREFFADVAQYFHQNIDHPLCRFMADSIATTANYDLLNIGKLLHMVSHSGRVSLDELLAEFASRQTWWTDPAAQAAFELDLLARPYVYREPVSVPEYAFEHLEVVDRGRYHVTISLPDHVVELLRDLDQAEVSVDRDVRIDHQGRRKMPYPRRRSLEHNAAYCQVMMGRLRDILPAWSPCPRERVA